MKLSRYEQETIINFNAEEKMATVYTADKAVMRKIDALVIAFPEVYKQVSETEYTKTYEMPKTYVNLRKPRIISETQRQEAKKRMKEINQRKRRK